MDTCKLYNVWLCTTEKEDFTSYARRSQTRARMIAEFIDGVERRAELSSVIRAGLMTRQEVSEFDAPVRLAGIEVLPAIK